MDMRQAMVDDALLAALLEGLLPLSSAFLLFFLGLAPSGVAAASLFAINS